MLQVQDLVLLGLLKESPKHGYEIKQVVDERMQRIARITSGTVYYTLRKLEEKGFVTKTRARSAAVLLCARHVLFGVQRGSLLHTVR